MAGPGSNRNINLITALWVLNETVLGGILHALYIPLTGMIIGSGAVGFIILLAYFSGNKNVILRATLLVIILKFLGSPHTPLNAYFAVAFQGIMGEYLFRWIKIKRLSAILLGILASAQSAFQKLIILTIIFGNNFWTSLDVFGNYILDQFSIINLNEIHIRLSMILIAAYGFMHITAGFIVGLWVPGFAIQLQSERQSEWDPSHLQETVKMKTDSRPKHMKKTKLSTYLFIIILAFILAGSYLFPIFEESKGWDVIIMIIRSILIMTVWYFIIAPFILKKFKQYIKKEQVQYSTDISEIMRILPVIRYLATWSWSQCLQMPWIKRAPCFLRLLMSNAIYTDFNALKIQDK